MRARALLASTLAAATLATGAASGAGTAAAAPPYVSRDDAALQEEARDTYQAPAWMLDPANQRGGALARPYGPADIIVGVTLVVGLVFLW